MRKQTFSVALCGILTALGTALMLLGGVFPSTTLAAPMLASLALLPARDELGTKAAVLVYVATGLLTLLLDADKGAAIMYLLLGYYPLLKPWFELRKPVIAMAMKLLLVALAVAASYGVMIWVFQLDWAVEELQTATTVTTVLSLAMGLVAFFLYDFLLKLLVVVYRRRLAPLLRKIYK